MLKWYSNVSGTSHEAEIQRPAVRQRRLWPYLFALSLLPAAAAQEQTISPAQALAFDSGQPITARALEQAVREGDPWEQLDWTFTLRPSLLYRQYLDERGGDDLSPRLSSTLQVRFSETPLQAVQRAGRLERALRAHDRAKRLEKRDALLAFAELLLAQDAFTLAAASLNNLAPDASQLERQGAELALRIEEAGLNAARLAAAKFGMYGTAQYHPIRFVVPAAPRVRNLSDYRAQELVLAEAETRYLAAGGAGVLRDFRLGVGYRTDGMEVDFEAGLMAGRPGLRLGTIHPGGRARMDVRVSDSGAKTGRRMGHMSLSGPDGTLAAFADSPVARKVLIHINNTNPILDEDSPQRAEHEGCVGARNQEVDGAMIEDPQPRLS